MSELNCLHCKMYHKKTQQWSACVSSTWSHVCFRSLPLWQRGTLHSLVCFIEDTVVSVFRSEWSRGNAACSLSEWLKLKLSVTFPESALTPQGQCSTKTVTTAESHRWCGRLYKHWCYLGNNREFEDSDQQCCLFCQSAGKPGKKNPNWPKLVWRVSSNSFLPFLSDCEANHKLAEYHRMPNCVLFFAATLGGAISKNPEPVRKIKRMAEFKNLKEKEPVSGFQRHKLKSKTNCIFNLFNIHHFHYSLWMFAVSVSMSHHNEYWDNHLFNEW